MKKFITNTIIFTFILIFIAIYKTIFGEANLLVGIGTLICIVVLMQTNLTKRPLYNLISLLVIFLSLGLLSYAANWNLVFECIINFIVLTVLGYLLSYNLSKSLIVPTGFLYLFMTFDPVYGKDYGLRLLGLFVGPFLIMAIQYAIYRKKTSVTVENSSLLQFGPINDSGYKEYHLFGKTFKLHTTRAAFALRIGILTAIASLFQRILLLRYNIPEGRWLVYTIFSLTELYSQNCHVKSKQRLAGTLIGSAILFVLFTIFQDPIIRSIIFLVVGYLNTYMTNYRDSMILVTISSVAATSINGGTLHLIFYRILFVVLGVVLALLGDRFLFSQAKPSE